jgi:hypothetical protein
VGHVVADERTDGGREGDEDNVELTSACEHGRNQDDGFGRDDRKQDIESGNCKDDEVGDRPTANETGESLRDLVNGGADIHRGTRFSVALSS